MFARYRVGLRSQGRKVAMSHRTAILKYHTGNEGGHNCMSHHCHLHKNQCKDDGKLRNICLTFDEFDVDPAA